MYLEFLKKKTILQGVQMETKNLTPQWDFNMAEHKLCK